MSAHFEIHVGDMARAQTFYTGLFGWSFTPLDDGADVEYHLIQGDNLGEGLSGGMMRRMGPAPDKGSPIRGATLTFPVADVDQTYEKALATGGAEALAPADYPGIGRIAYCEDGEGNVFGFATYEGGH